MHTHFISFKTVILRTISANYFYFFAKRIVFIQRKFLIRVSYFRFYDTILCTIPAAYLQSLTEGYSSLAFNVRDRPDIAVDPEQLKRERKKA